MGRMPLSRRSLIDTNFLSSFFRSPSNVMECRDLRSRFSADLCNATERGKDISLVSLADVDTWFDQACDVLRDMDRYQRLLAPLPSSPLLLHFQLLCCLFTFNSNIRLRTILLPDVDGHTVWLSPPHALPLHTFRPQRLPSMRRGRRQVVSRHQTARYLFDAYLGKGCSGRM